jgi:hypothetical protein
MMQQYTFEPAPAAKAERRDIVTQLIGANSAIDRKPLLCPRKFPIASLSAPT